MKSFLQAVSKVTEEAPTPLRVVQMEGLVRIATEPLSGLLFSPLIWLLER
jgi:hypothetical protein